MLQTLVAANRAYSGLSPARANLRRLNGCIVLCLSLLLCSFTANANDPVVSVLSPMVGEAVVHPFTVSGQATDDDEVTSVQLAIRSQASNQYWNGVGFQSAYTRVSASLSGPKKNKTWTYDQLPDVAGQYFIAAWVWDAQSNFAGPTTTWYQLVGTDDNQNPSVSIANVSNGNVFNSPFTMTGTAADDQAVDRVELAIRDRDQAKYWNGSSFQTAYTRVLTSISGDPQSSTWTYADFPEQSGVYTVAAFVWDESGNFPNPSSVWFRLSSAVQDTLAPDTTINSPVVAGESLSNPYSLSGVVTDDTEIDRVEVAIRHQEQAQYWDGQAFVSSYVRIPAIVSGGDTNAVWEVENPPELEGAYNISVWSWDASQNFKSPSTTWFHLVSGTADNIQPEVFFDATSSATTVAAPYLITGWASDNVQVDRVELVIRKSDTNLFWNGTDFQAQYVRLPTETTVSGTTANWLYANAPADEGTYILAAWVWDTSALLPTSASTWLAVGESPPAPPGVNIANYDLVFSDEFNDFALDENNWNTSLYWGPYRTINAEEQFYVDTLGMHSDFDFTPFEFTGESLIINAVETTANLQPPAQPPESDPFWAQDPDKSYSPEFDASHVDYLSGIITSATDFNFTHGYVEARVKLPSGRGLWPAFWLLNTKYVENSPEIDIMEYLGHNTDKVFHTYHYFDVENDWAKISSPTYETLVDNLHSQFHTYGLAWEADQLIFYVDGVETQRITDADMKISTQSMYIIANLAVGGAWPGSPDASTSFPVQYELDYIRVYKKKPVTPITPAALQNEFQLMFSDEFNGGSVDANKWNTTYLWGPYFPINNEEQIYLDKFGHHADHPINPLTVDNGVLNIRADAVSIEDLPSQPAQGSPDWIPYANQQYNAGYMQPGGWTPNYTSGMLTSYDSFKFVHGYVEMRAKLPEGAGLWPAFWLLNGYYVGSQPEIDIMEFQGEHPGTVHHSYHFYDTTGQINSSAETHTLPNDASFSEEFHTFGVEWRPGVINWYVDGQITRTLNTDDVSTQLMYIIVNLAVGGNFVGPVDTSVFPSDFTIDYIRAYQRKSTP